MARVRDVTFGMLLGAICTGAIASLAAAPRWTPLSSHQSTIKSDSIMHECAYWNSAPSRAIRKECTATPRALCSRSPTRPTRIRFPMGSASTHSAKQGDVEWSDAVTHSGENVGNSDGHFYRIELKNCTK